MVHLPDHGTQGILGRKSAGLDGSIIEEGPTKVYKHSSLTLRGSWNHRESLTSNREASNFMGEIIASNFTQAARLITIEEDFSLFA